MDDGAQEGARLAQPTGGSVHQEISSRVAALLPRHSTRAWSCGGPLFLDRIATHILAFEDDSSVLFFDGNYTQYEADRKARLGIAADTPHRIKYRSLTRI